MDRLRTSLGAAAMLTGAVLLGSAAVAGGPWGAEYFPNVPLTTQHGTAVHFYDDLIKGKAVVINLVYTRCTASCPLETAKLAQVQRLLGDRVGKDVFFYSISIDPEHDTPQALEAYARRFHVGPGWLFLTGKHEDIQLVSKKLGLASLIDRWNRDGHQPALMVGNESTGAWMRSSAVENPKFLARMMSDFFGWNGKPVRTYAAPVAIPRAGKGEFLFNTRCASCHSIGKGDALIAISFPPYGKETLFCTRLARQRKAKVIAISESDLGPLAAHANVLLKVDEASAFAFRALTSTICLCQALFVALAYRLEVKPNEGAHTGDYDA